MLGESKIKFDITKTAIIDMLRFRVRERANFSLRRYHKKHKSSMCAVQYEVI